MRGELNPPPPEAACTLTEADVGAGSLVPAAAGDFAMGQRMETGRGKRWLLHHAFTRRPAASGPPKACTTLRAPCAARSPAHSSHGGPCPPGDARDPPPRSPLRSPGHLLSLSSPRSSPRQMLQLFSLFRLQQKPLQAHKGEEQKRGPGLNKSHLPGARAPPCNRGAAPQAAPLRRAHCPAAKKDSWHVDFKEMKLQSRYQERCPGCRGPPAWWGHRGRGRREGTGRQRAGGGCGTHGKSQSR